MIKTGWTVGGGLEQQVSRNWLVRLDYRYANYGTLGQQFFTPGSSALADDRFTANVKAQTHNVNLGLGYKF